MDDTIKNSLSLMLGGGNVNNVFDISLTHLLNREKEQYQL